MSMKTDVIYGYGFEIHADEKTIMEFVRKHSSTIVKRKNNRELELMEECHNGNYEGIKEDYCDIECDLTGHGGLYAIISNIMTSETGIRFQYECGDCDCNSDESIMFCPVYPWQCNEKEKCLTEEQLEKIVNKYVEELGIITTVGYLEVEYFG